MKWNSESMPSSRKISWLNGVMFQLALKVQLRKDNPDGSEEYTDPVLRYKQKALLQASDINEDLNKAIPHLLELLGK